ncbi:MAG: hypothetical protein LUD17_03925 [Bacteroidales bacterium]|nr:hypothetical protein [Bacteroidales bacterium]
MAEEKKNTKKDGSEKPKPQDQQNANASDNNQQPIPEPLVEEAITPNRSYWWLWVILAVIVIGFIWWWVCLPSANSEEVIVPINNETPDGAVTAPTADPLYVPAEGTEDESQANPEDGDKAAAAIPTGKAARGLKAGGNAASAQASNADIDVLAKKTIKGNYGNGKVRKQKLGDKYPRVQARVNQMMRRHK